MNLQSNPLFMNTLAGVFCIAIILGTIWYMFKPPAQPKQPTGEQLQQMARQIVLKQKNPPHSQIITFK